MSIFTNAFKVVVGEEGGLSTDPADPGNWTGGACGKGVCRGTKFGIAAASHPDLDIVDLTLEQAQQIYEAAYWQPIRGDLLPKAFALLVFDAAVNCGVDRATLWLQTAIGCAADGEIGPKTLTVLEQIPSDSTAYCAEFLAQRLTWMSSLPTWHVFALGWARRLCNLPYLSLTLGDA